MDIENVSIDEITQNIQTQTSVSSESLLGTDRQNDLDKGWHDTDRKAIHEDYWGNVVYREAKARLDEGELSFDELWEHLNIHEFLEGSAAGRKAQAKSAMRGLFTNTASENTAASGAALHRNCIKFMHKGHVGDISPFSMCSLKRDRMLTLLSRFVKPGDAIVDLGSGWGRYSTLFAHRMRDVSIYAGEISEAGRATTKLISDHYSLGIGSFAFNYYEWNGLLSVLKECKRDRVVLFSNFSIEQATYINLDLYRDVLALGKQIQFVHIEPVGWQTLPSQDALRFSTPPARRLGPGQGYNKNLLVVVKKLADTDAIKDVNVEPNYIAFGNIRNSGTLLTFRSN
ncbi:hypothetical protein CA51_18070 [Rosistilla oblonga]|uniref:hypothetical protein n=1 Tax=Rosistilla oblonga TaxID=2527990 RepID=UPI00118D4827|nr:hypothetical protein [Rosistilla oblonga]QDV11931.1 hypothetical protein CA51_18070 [Rosistilla oblonga]